ncbi:hypothetical protein VB737_08295 [Synechococcus sp. BA-120 BA3]|nr:hypothetical protein [Synechococcus sp. BA-120 BA3]
MARRRRSKPKHSGGIDTITPGLIAGWAHCNDAVLTEVRLLAGSHLLGRTLINQHRQDVCQKLGLEGTFGFQLELSGDLPAVIFEDPPRLLGLSVDGSTTVELLYQPQPSSTAEHLKTVLAPQVRGAVGHFDGLSPDGDALQGWCFRRGQSSEQPIEVWLLTAGQPAIELRCDRYRLGMGAQGFPERCGFEIELHELPPAWAGQEVQVCFDAEGSIQLPGAGAVRLPCVANAEITTAEPLMHPASGSPYASQVAMAPPDLRANWQALEQYRQFLDSLDAQVSRAEAFQQQRREQQSLEASRPRRKRDRLLRLFGFRS